MGNRKQPQHQYHITTDTIVQMSHLHLRRRLARPGKTSESRHLGLLLIPLHHINIHISIHKDDNPNYAPRRPLHPIPKRNTPRLPTRRRTTRPLNLDPPPHDGSHVPENRKSSTTRRYARVPEVLLQTISVLGVRGRFPGVDGTSEWAESAAAGREGGFRVVAV